MKFQIYTKAERYFCFNITTPKSDNMKKKKRLLGKNMIVAISQ